MSLYNRTTTLLIGGALCALSACGFEPIYGTNSQTSKLQGKIAYFEPDTREEYNLVQDLKTQFGDTGKPEYLFQAELSTTENPIGRARDTSIARYHIVGSAQYTLREINTGEIVHSGDVSSFTAYSATGSTIDAITNPRDAYRRLMNILASKIATKTTAFFEDQK